MRKGGSGFEEKVERRKKKREKKNSRGIENSFLLLYASCTKYDDEKYLG